MSKHLKVAAVVLSSCLAMSAQAGTIPYPDIGTEAPSESFYATGGDITAYFYGSSAGYTSRVGVWIGGVMPTVYGLQNNTSLYGDSLVLGTAVAGEELVFELQVLGTDLKWYSVAWFNSDLKNHVYSTDFGGAGLVPAGTYVGFEDLPGLGDVDYNDHQFVFTNVSTKVPEPLTMVLFGMGLAALGFTRRRKV